MGRPVKVLEAVEHAIIAYNPSDETLADAAESIALRLVEDLNEQGFVIVNVTALSEELRDWQGYDCDDYRTPEQVIAEVASA